MAKVKSKRKFNPWLLTLIAVPLVLVGLYIVYRAVAANADINGDGTVNISDLSVLASNFGGSGKTFAQGDLNADGSVNILDFSILAFNWGATAPSPGGSIPIGPRTVTVSATGTVRSANSTSTICSAIAASNGGDTVQIASGTYGAISCSAKNASSEIKIMPAPGANVNIAGATIALGSRNLSFYNIRWTGGITISSYGTAAGAGSHNISFKGGRVDLPVITTNGSTNGFSIGGGNSNLVFEDLTLTGGNSHFNINCVEPATCTDGIHILNNDSQRVQQDHVIINRGKNIHVRRNLLHDVIDTGQHSDGVQTVSVNGLWVERNKFYNTTADRDSFSNRNDQGIMINEIPSENRYNTNIHIYNNLFYNSIGTALAIAGGRDIEIYNNTIFDCNNGGSGRCVVFDPASGNTVERMYVWNNIFENFTITNSQVSFNSNNSVGAFSNFMNPSAGDYRLKAAVAGIAAGIGIGGASINAPTIDLDGVTRGNPPDRGAYEF